MAVIEKAGDLLKIIKSGVIVHGCNAQGVMASGFAGQLAKMYPVAKSSYVSFIEQWDITDRFNALGSVNYIEIVASDTTVDVIDPGSLKNLIICNAITQEYYGRESGTRYASYDAIDIVMRDMADTFCSRDIINMPRIGCGLGGAEWSIVKEIIKHRLSNFEVHVWSK